MFLDYFFSFLGETIAGLIIQFLAVAVLALAFSPLLRVRWNVLLREIEDFIAEFADRTVRRILGME